MLNCCIICRIYISFQLNECVGINKITFSMPLVRKWNMFENNACMLVCMYIITKYFCSRSLVCSKTVHFPLLHGPNNVRDQIALKIKLLSVCCVITGNLESFIILKDHMLVFRRCWRMVWHAIWWSLYVCMVTI